MDEIIKDLTEQIASIKEAKRDMDARSGLSGRNPYIRQ